MSAQGPAISTKPKKPPTKYQYRLTAGRFNKGVATGLEGKVISVMSASSYLTARDVANQLRIEPHVAQGRLQRLLAKGAVERRIIPGSVYDESVNEPSLPFKAGDIVESAPGGQWLNRRGVITRADNLGFDVVSEDLLLHRIDLSEATYEKLRWDVARCLQLIGPTPNPIAFNQRKYAECFDAPKAEPSAEKFVEKVVDEAMNQAPFKVGDVLVAALGGRYKVEEILPNQTLKTLGLKSGLRFDWGFEKAKSFLALEQPAPPPRRFIIARPELLPLDVLSEVSKVFSLGADKYERDDWAKPDNGGGNHVEAALRHINKFNAGEIVEGGVDGSTLHHLDHAIARLMMARGKELRGQHQ